MDKALLTRARTLASDFLKFANAGASPYHAVNESKRRLLLNDFEHLEETEDWKDKIKPGGKYMVSRGGSSITAFKLGTDLTKNNTFFKVIGAHTDSPCLRLAPKTKSSTEGFQMAYIQTYGGGLWHTWLDRDLIVAGRVIVRSPDGTLRQCLYRSTTAVDESY